MSYKVSVSFADIQRTWYETTCDEYEMMLESYAQEFGAKWYVTYPLRTSVPNRDFLAQMIITNADGSVIEVLRLY